ncbi:MAG TPA: VOC family protein [Pyrinomonadaceae bacterium]|jgi:predicted enzyme related to lactoylglutathione lyase
MSEQTATATEPTKQDEAPKHGTFCWADLGSPDLEATKKFYAELLGWKFAESNAAGMSYTEIVAGDEHIGGMYQMGPEMCGDGTSHWVSYIAVDDVDEAARRVSELGGKVSVPPTDIPNVGRFCVISDPTGATISLYASARGK